jgi:hypothetical protein
MSSLRTYESSRASFVVSLALRFDLSDMTSHAGMSRPADRGGPLRFAAIKGH